MSTLPVATTSFVGRGRELAKLRRLLSDARLVTVTGAGGVGKTRLALRAAAAARPAFPDGVHLVELDALRDPGLLAQTVVKAVGLRTISLDPVARLIEYLKDRDLLLVLDNCEHLADGCAMLVSKLLTAVPGLRVLATSRHLLGVDGEQAMRLAPLPVPVDVAGMARSAAVSLFVDRAVAVDSTFVVDERNREQVLAICRRLDGLPLAIELAAVWVRALSVREILDRLDDRFALLAKGRRGAPTHQQTLAAALRWSYHLCSSAERSLWSRLSVFVGGFDLEAAQEVCTGADINRAQVPGLIARLVDKSILAVDPETDRHHIRYRMLDTIREYGLDLLSASGHEAMFRTRHRGYYRKLVQRYAADSFGPRQLEWIQLLLAEHPNIRAVLESALSAPGQAEIATEIATTLRWFWYAGGFPCEGFRWLRLGLALDTEPTIRRAHALWVCSFMAASFNEVDAASRMLTECAELSQRLSEPKLRTDYVFAAGFAALRRGDSREAIALLEEAVAGYQKINDPERLLNSLFVLAMASLFDRPDRGAHAAAWALKISRRHKPSWQESHILYSVAVYKWRSGEYQRGEALLRKAIRQRSPVPDWAVLSQMVEALAWCASGAGQPHRAARLLGAANVVFRRGGMATLVQPFRGIDNQIVDNISAEIGEDQFLAELDTGLGYTIDQVIDEALRPRTPNPAHRRTARLLTRRQSEIAELIAEGLTNREIACKLTIAQRTADAHVQNILTKLGFTTRAQIAAWITSNP